MRTLHLINSLDPAAGGPVEGLRQLTLALAAQGIEPTIVSIGYPDADRLSIPHATVIDLGPTHGAFGYAPRLMPWLHKNSGQFDAVTIHGLWQFHALAAWWVLRASTVPYFVFPHGMLDPWFKHQYPFKHVKKMAYWRLIQHRVLRAAAGVLFTCEEERIRARKSFRPYRVKEFVVSYGTSGPKESLQQSRAAFLDANPQLREQRIILFLGRLHEKKGCDLLLKAFAAVAPADQRLKLVLAGPDQTHWRADLERLASKLGIAHRVFWPGMLLGEVKWGAYAAAELFVLPSHQENFGIAVVEALASATPVLVTNKVNIWREIEASQGGLICEDSADSIELALRKWLALSPDQRTDFSTMARACFLRNFAMGSAARRFLEIMQISQSATR